MSRGVNTGTVRGELAGLLSKQNYGDRPGTLSRGHLYGFGWRSLSPKH